MLAVASCYARAVMLQLLRAVMLAVAILCYAYARAVTYACGCELGVALTVAASSSWLSWQWQMVQLIPLQRADGDMVTT